jgi:hypothetical protein
MRASVENFRASAAAAASDNGRGGRGRTNTTTAAEFESIPPSRMGMGSIPLQPGELEGMYERPTSAPPPPGFGAGPEERNRLATELLWGQSEQHQQQASTDEIYNSLGLQMHQHSTSATSNSTFNDLADVLGSGLMESMADATGGNSKKKQQQPDYSNLHRQTRHAASRLLGATPPDFKDPVYQHHSHGNNKGQGAPPASLFSANAAPFKMEAYSRAPGAAPTQQDRGSVSRGFPDIAVSLEPLKHGGTSGTTTPVQMFPGQQGERRSLPAKDIGMNVVEPEGENHLFRGGEQATGSIRQRVDLNRANGIFGQQHTELERGLQNMWTPLASAGAAQLDKDDGNSTISDSLGAGTEFSARQAEAELRPFLWDINRNKPSRTLAILHVSWLRAPDVRSSCEGFGVLESFRADFSSRGIYFVSYYDIRSAQYAALELQSILQRQSLAQRSSEEVIVRCCLPLNSSSQFDEGQILIHSLPPEYNEHNLAAMLSSFGAVRSVLPQGEGSFAIEFHNIQDTKQALLELDSSQPWGESVTVEVGLRNPVERKIGRDLLAMISRWRQLENQKLNTDPGAYPGAAAVSDRWRPPTQPSLTPAVAAPPEAGGFGYGRAARPQETTQLVLGPDGRYTQIVVQNPAPNYSPYAHQGAHAVDQRHQQQPQQQQQQIIHGPNGQIYIATVPSVQQNVYLPQQQHGSNVAYPATILANTPYADSSRGRSVQSGQSTGTPYYNQVSSDAASVSVRSHRSAHSQSEDKDTRHLMLDLDAVEAGLDTRTSLMVRNIPNKYTQQMLLSEFTENGHGPGVIDFFYLPIDFKNRCNRGYAFINFVDHKDILAFHVRYFGKHWRTFNSDKICDITYARIQGKAAMLKRFENSALMEKDDEYKPLVFVSDGPEKGKRLPFPDATTKTS